MSPVHDGDVPGTILLVDADGHSSAAHRGQVILQPHPSADPEDPLNWSYWRKFRTIMTVYLYTFGIGICTAVQYSVLNQISEKQNVTVSQLNLGTGLMFLFLGWACPIWQPLACTYGRRGVYISSIILSMIPTIWTPFSTGPGQWYAHRIILGIFASPVESLPEVSVPDLFFAHERGTYMALYAFILFGSNFLAPFFAGFINDAAGYHWVMYFATILNAVCAIIMFIFMEDTIYFRKTAEGAEDNVVDEKGTSPSPTVTEQPITADDQPSKRNTKMFSLVVKLPGRPTFKQTLLSSWRSFKIFAFFPTILWSGLLYGTNLSWYNIINATMSSILNNPPYNFSPAMVGVAYLSPFTFAGIASLWAGNMADWVALRLARRNNGIREPEQRLWVLLLSALLSSGGLILWGVGASRGLHFMALIFGIGFVTFGVICGGAISLAYAVDSFKDVAGESMVTIIIIRNTLGFAFSYAINPWINNLGLQDCFISVAMISLGCTLTFLLMIAFGKRLRKLSAKKYWKYVEEDKGRGFGGAH
jgi:MFS family permease